MQLGFYVNCVEMVHLHHIDSVYTVFTLFYVESSARCRSFRGILQSGLLLSFHSPSLMTDPAAAAGDQCGRYCWACSGGHQAQRWPRTGGCHFPKLNH